MPFIFERLSIPDIIRVESRAFNDERGYFKETYKKSEFEKANILMSFVQDNVSWSQKYVLRGLHFQRNPHAQGKLVSVMSGKILDVAVDLREGSQTYGKYVSEILSDENHRLLWVPPGFAHGFLALEESVVHYKVTREYNKESESGIMWNDSIIDIDWPIEKPLLSGKDELWGSSEGVLL